VDKRARPPRGAYGVFSLVLRQRRLKPELKPERRWVRSHSSVARYNQRASGYEEGLLGRWHRDIVERTAALTSTVLPDGGVALDIGCGSGALVRSLGPTGPKALLGVDPSPQMLTVAINHPARGQAVFARAVAEALPCPSATCDVVVSSVSFGHWADQRRGLRECRRVLVEGGSLVLVDVFSRWLNIATRRGNRFSAHTRGRTTTLLRESGFQSTEWHDIYGRVIAAVVAT
jgi:ubiquinone/menaquinone biosynthesis C-methylase UbiE